MFRIGRCATALGVVGLLASCAPDGKPAGPSPQASATHTLAVQAGPQPPVPAAPPANAEALNAARPFAADPIEPMRPFVLKASAGDRDRALHCLTEAVYYEAAREPLSGQQAVAQVVLNRVRHPAYPKSVCGVVYQGSAKATGCQFTFTCNGAMRWRPEPALWDRAQTVARRALAGYVDTTVGSATHYHADYVSPYWAPSLLKMTQVGAHIFYRWSGAWGRPAAFVGRYGGHEADLTPQILDQGDADLAAPEPRKVTLQVAGEARTYNVAAAAAPGAAHERVAGALQPARPTATPEQVQQINANLLALEKRLDEQGAAKTAATTTAAPSAPSAPAAAADAAATAPAA